jgi:hypothetical protein
MRILRSCAAFHFVFATRNIVTLLEFGKIRGGIRRLTDTSALPNPLARGSEVSTFLAKSPPHRSHSNASKPDLRFADITGRVTQAIMRFPTFIDGRFSFPIQSNSQSAWFPSAPPWRRGRPKRWTRPHLRPSGRRLFPALFDVTGRTRACRETLVWRD